jgi:altronate hydrolase
MADALVLHPTDTVAVAVRAVSAGQTLTLGGDPGSTVRVTAAEDIAPGHKIALSAVPEGTNVVKYGLPIGRATTDIPAGAWIHSHNLRTNLGSDLAYRFDPTPHRTAPGSSARTFRGYRRAHGLVGIRNDLYIVPTVGCINALCEGILRDFDAAHPEGQPFDSAIVMRHPYGCSQLGGDLEMTRQILQDIVRHPNAGGVLVVGLGCENNQLDELRAGLGDHDPARVRFMVAQDVDDEYETGVRLLGELREAALGDRREEVPISELRVGVKCGGSDGFSGISANPLIGRFTDWLVSHGGSVVLTEVPEMFGAETVLMSRARDAEVFHEIVGLINDFKDYFRRYDQPIYENPSPGNKAGGITTLEEKSLGCTQKAGTAEVQDVLAYGATIRRPGLSLLQGPGNDLVSSSALASAGCQLVLFSTGRGTPFGTYVPTLKIASNTPLAQRKARWIDFDGGRTLAEPMDQVLDDFVEFVSAVVDGAPTRNEKNGMQEIAIFKDGVTE